MCTRRPAAARSGGRRSPCHPARGAAAGQTEQPGAVPGVPCRAVPCRARLVGRLSWCREVSRVPAPSEPIGRVGGLAGTVHEAAGRTIARLSDCQDYLLFGQTAVICRQDRLLTGQQDRLLSLTATTAGFTLSDRCHQASGHAAVLTGHEAGFCRRRMLSVRPAPSRHLRPPAARLHRPARARALMDFTAAP